MNSIQKIAVVVGLVLILVLGLYAPAQARSRTDSPFVANGRRAIWNMGVAHETLWLEYQVNIPQLLAEWFVVTAGCGIFLLVVGLAEKTKSLVQS